MFAESRVPSTVPRDTCWGYISGQNTQALYFQETFMLEEEARQQPTKIISGYFKCQEGNKQALCKRIMQVGNSSGW